jgi:hypothetical protein
MTIYCSDALKEKVARTAAAAEQAFSLKSVGDRCIIMPQLPANCVIRITWRADLIDSVKWSFSDVLHLLHPLGSSEMQGEAHFDFCTYHPVSRQGLVLLLWRRILCIILGFLVYFPISIGIVLPFLLLFLYVTGNDARNSAELVAIMVAVTAGSTLLIMGGFRARAFVRRLAQPGSLHAIGGPRIEIHEIEKLKLPWRAN